MASVTLILGESGTGKSTSLREFDPAETLLIQAVKKPLPFKSANWTRFDKKDNPSGNVFVTDDSASIIMLMEKSRRPIIVLDDFQYVLANEFMRRTAERGFDKFTEIARHAWDVFTAAASLADERRVYILSHTATDDHGNTKIKTIGKLLDEKITLEGMVSIVLKTRVVDGRYLFSTRNSGSDTVKTPMGMFDDAYIDNNLASVDRAICDYYGINQPA
jgi:hypothetical protein